MSIGENIKEIKEELPSDVTLIAVTKTRTIEEMNEAYDIGMRDFGENKVQELLDKYEKFDSTVRWHLIGHLQRNKVKFIVGKVNLIHSLDSNRLLQEIENQYTKADEVANVLIQINIGKEDSKTGILLEELEELILACESCKNVKVKGLMAIIPKGDEISCKNNFRAMKKIFDELSSRNFKNITMKYLSMGMSGDYNIAISEGSNMVRVGEGIFGKRNYNTKE